MKYIQAVNSTNLILVEDDDFIFLNKFKWKINPEGYVSRSKDNRLIHRVILSVKSRTVQVDHIDLNKLNNLRSNLRLVTNSQNTQNQGARKGSTSKYRGVCWHSRANKWMADVMLNGKHNYLGLFDVEEEAAMAASNFRKANMPYSIERESFNGKEIC